MINTPEKELHGRQKTEKLLFAVIALALIIFSLLSTTESRAYKFVSNVEKDNMELLTAVSGIKMVLASVSEIDISFLRGQVQEVIRVIDKAENILIISSVISFVQMVLLKASKSVIFPLISLALLAGTFSNYYGTLCKKLLIIVLAVSPGLTIYSIGMHRLSQEFDYDFGDGFSARLTAVSQQMQSEKARLMQMREAALKKAEHDNAVERFFEKVKADITYDVKRVVDDIDGDIKTIRLMIKLGGTDILKGVVEFSAHIFIFMFLLPMGYALLLYVLISSMNLPLPHQVQLSEPLFVPIHAPEQTQEESSKNSSLQTQTIKAENTEKAKPEKKPFIRI